MKSPPIELVVVLGHEESREAGLDQHPPAAQVALALLQPDAEDVSALAQERCDPLEAIAGAVLA